MKKHRLFLILLIGSMLLAPGTDALAGGGVLTLPDSLSVIGEEAFAGTTSFEEVIVPEGATGIGSRAFAGSALSRIVLPASIESIAEDAFDGCGDLTVVAPAGSFAYQWALERGMIRPRYRALVIGEYAYSSGDLVGCDNDARAMAGMLSGLENGFEVTPRQDMTKAQLLNLIDSAFAGATDDDVSLFYYSGHGVMANGDEVNHGALLCVDDRSVTFQELAAALSRVGGRIIVILDSCHSGASIARGQGDSFDPEAFNSSAIAASPFSPPESRSMAAFSAYTMRARGARSGELATSKFIVITAASADQSSYGSSYGYDGSGYAQGCFTAAFIKGMGCLYPNGLYTGATPADTDGDSIVTLSEIFTYAKNAASGWKPAQTAQCYGTGSEALFFR